MGNSTPNTRNPGEDEGEVHVAIDPRGVILDLPEEACVASLLRTRGLPGDRTRGLPGDLVAARPPAHTRAPRPRLAPSFWHRLRFGATKPAAD
jgi:hypothetical protein